MSKPKMKGFLESLTVNETAIVFEILLKENPGLVKEAYKIAKEVVGNVTEDELKEMVYDALEALDVDDLYSRSGKTRYGYVDPNEESWEMFEEALNSFIVEMKKNQKRSLPAAAKTYCVGIVKGLLKYEKESSSDFADWVMDAPGEYISRVVDEWKEGNPPGEDIDEVMTIVEELRWS